MANYPLLSIITSNLNSGVQLQKTLDWFQKNKPLSVEYIVIDGASSDSSCDLIQGYSGVVDKFISESDFGIYDAWNKGIAIAEGSYICFLGAGDIFEADALSVFLQYASANPSVDFISGRVLMVDNQNHPIRTVGRAWKWSSFRRHSYVAHPGSFHSRRLFSEYGPYDFGYKIAGDYEFLLRSGKFLRTKFFNLTLVRMLEGGVSQIGYNSLYEEFEAKIKNQTVLPLIAYCDLFIAMAKQWARTQIYQYVARGKSVNMRVLTVNLSIHSESGGGTRPERTFQLSRWLAKKNCECTVLTLDQNLDGMELLSGASLVVLPCLWRRFYLPLGGFKVVKKLVQSTEIIHLMGHWSLLNAMVCFYALKFKKPYVICPAGALPIFGRSVLLKRIYNFFLGKRLVQKASGWIAITKLECEHFESYGVSSGKVAIFPNCINEAEFNPPTNFSESVFKETIPFSPYILFMGRLNLIKGPDLLLSAFIKIKQLYPQFHLVFAGPDNGMLNALMVEVELYCLQKQVHFIGNIEGPLKVMVYRNASLLVVPSRHEAMSIVAVEAGICGIPVLLTDECGLEEIQEVNQTLVTKACSDAIAESLRVLLADESSLKKIGLSWREIVREKYRWDKLVYSYLEYFEKLLVIHQARK